MNTSKLKLGNISVVFPNFQTTRVAKTYLKDDYNKQNSLHLSSEYASILVLGHYLALKNVCFLAIVMY